MTDIDTAAKRALALGLMTERLKTADSLNRQSLVEAMEVTDRKAVVLPLNGQPTVVGSVTLAKGSVYASVTDMAALIEWVEQNRPDELVPVTTVTIRASYLDHLLSQAKKDGEAISNDGELIPGITVREGQPTVKVIREKSIEAQAAIVDAIFSQDSTGLRALLAGDS